MFAIIASLEFRRSWRSDKSSWAYEKKNLDKIREQIISKTKHIENFVLTDQIEDEITS